MSQPLSTVNLRYADVEDIDALLQLEQQCFSNDRLSKRSFRRHILSEHSDVVLAEYRSDADSRMSMVGYVLCLRHRGTRLARLYSLAVLPAARGTGIARSLLQKAEQIAAEHARLYMRLEVAKDNAAAIRLYEAHGYRVFGEYFDYYEDHSDALRMQKRIRQIGSAGVGRLTPWYQQTTDFTCGPASLMMAMSSLNPDSPCDQSLELDLWREATTIFMTSGHGGCHPFGLALAAHKRGFSTEVWVNTNRPLFVDGVRIEEKKQIMTLVHHQFVAACEKEGVGLHYDDVTQFQLETWLQQGCSVLVLISTYRLDGKKTPHWVVVTGIDEHCLYVHDPDLDEKRQNSLDCQHIPIAREDFGKMSAFGLNRLRCAVVLQRPPQAR